MLRDFSASFQTTATSSRRHHQGDEQHGLWNERRGPDEPRLDIGGDFQSSPIGDLCEMGLEWAIGLGSWRGRGKIGRRDRAEGL